MGSAAHHDRPDSNLGPFAGCCFDADRLANPAAPGHCRGRRHDDIAAADALLDAGAVQLLRPPRAAGSHREHGALRYSMTEDMLTPVPQPAGSDVSEIVARLLASREGEIYRKVTL